MYSLGTVSSSPDYHYIVKQHHLYTLKNSFFTWKIKDKLSYVVINQCRPTSFQVSLEKNTNILNIITSSRLDVNDEDYYV